VTIFFITSSDSGSLVIDIISAGGHTDPPTRQRIFWAVLEGVVAGTLLLGGGLSALQTAVTMTGFPFAIVMLIAVYGLFIGLQRELRHLDAAKARAEKQAASSAT
jgi:choline/glycine/proline betaine transport protein